MTWLTAARRAWLYSISGAVLALLAVYGLLAPTLVPAWAALIAAVLWAAGNITAIRNTDSTGRAALYGVAVAVVVLLVAYGILDDTQASTWTALAVAVFGVGSQALARANVIPGEVMPDENMLAELGDEDVA